MPLDMGGIWVYASSAWVHRFKCDPEGGQLIIQFNDGFCCTYPGTDVNFFDIMLCWPSKGNFVNRFLKKPHWPYVQIAPPP